MPGALLPSSTTAVWMPFGHDAVMLCHCCKHTCHTVSLLLVCQQLPPPHAFLCLLKRMIPSIWRAIIVAEHVAQYPCWCLPALLPRLPQQEATTLALRSIVRARQRGASASAACRVGASVLVRGAIERGSRDNITVAVVDLRSRKESSSVGITSVASVLASQCSSDLSAWVAGGGSRKRRSSSGNDDEDGLPVPSAGVLQLQPLMAHSSFGAVPAAGGVAGVKPGGAGKPPTGPKGEAGGTAAARGGSSSSGSSSSAASNARRHTVSTTEAGGSSSSPGGCTPAPSSNGGNTARTQGMAWGWSLQGLQLLPHSPLPHPTSSIRALAQAAAAAVAAFSGTFGTLDRGVSGIPREVATSPAAAAAAAAGGSAAPVPAAAAAGVVAPPTPSMGELLSMQSAPALRQGASGRSSGGKPPLPRH